MKYKKTGAAVAVVLSLQLVLSGCWFNNSSVNKVVNKNTGKTETVQIVPGESNQDYKMLWPQTNDPVRGYIQYGETNLVDSDQLEVGLMDLSKSAFSPNQYVFQSGQYLKPSDINGILYRQGQEKSQSQSSGQQGKVLPGLNPPLAKGSNPVQQAQNSPKYMNYVLEQDYLKKAKNGKYTLGGVSIAVSLNSVYTDSITDSKGLINPISEQLNPSTVEAWGKAHAQQILQRIRSVSGLQQVPIFFTLYLAAAPEALVSGNFFASTYVGNGSSTIGNWTAVNENHVIFPSNTASSQYKSDSGKFNNFSSAVQKYFPDYVGVIGKGYYQDQTLEDLTLNINFNKFVDQTEIIGFTNYVASIVNNSFSFSNQVPVHIYITTGDVQDALIERTPSMNNAYVSIYQH
ncbi:CamS family sex pheromone protein [Sporolactobacillus pectinivorans]|uniref:CamS family sex pheromone protein n=1 Tax=Sporolactobacillus pectinivorans TaxID=1591408 RepID=UPI000C25B6AC|nr:CamS family sex pheromone protein [Sporolactobacillus pectinivorans]